MAANARSHHGISLLDETRSPLVRLCHRVVFGLSLAILIFAVAGFGGSRPTMQGPLIIAVAVTALVWALRICVVREATVVFSVLGAPLMIGGILVIAAYTLAEVEPVARLPMLLALAAVLYFFLILNDVRHRWQITTLVWVIVGLGVWQSLYAMWQVLGQSNAIWGRPRAADYLGSGSGTFPRPADLAAFLQIAFAVSAANFLFSRRSEKQRIGLGLASLLMLGGMFLTFSYWHWLGWLGMLIVLGYFVIRKRGWRFRWVVAAMLVLASAVVVALLLHGPRHHRHTPRPRDTAATVPVQSALSLSQLYLVRGAGPGMFAWVHPKRRLVQGLAERCPNEYLNILVEYGVTGLALVGWVIIAFLIGATQIVLLRDEKYVRNRLSNRYAFAVAGLTAVVGAVINAGIDLNLRAAGNLFALMTVMAATLTCGVHRRVGESESTHEPGRYVTIRLPGISRFVVAIGLVAVVALIASRIWNTYPAHVFLERGLRARADFRWDDAERDLLRAWKLDNRNFEAAAALGDLYAARATWNLARRDAHIKEAFIWYHRARTLNPHFLDVRLRTARLTELTGDVKQAAAFYREVVDGDPRNASYQTQLGYHYLRTGQTNLAQRAFGLARAHDAAEVLPTDEAATLNPPLPAPR
jgi:tetratricopeptide (TPR) repeat protein